MPAASNPCFVALNLVEITFSGPVDFLELLRFATIFLLLVSFLTLISLAASMGLQS